LTGELFIFMGKDKNGKLKRKNEITTWKTWKTNDSLRV